MMHGQKLLANAPEAAQRYIKDLSSQIISYNNNSSNNGQKYEYEKLVKIYINQDKLLEELLDYFMIKDEDNCSNSIIHR